MRKIFKILSRIASIVIVPIFLSCSTSSSEKNVTLNDFGRRAFNLHMDSFYHREAVTELVNTHKDSLLLNNILKIAETIDTLALTYFEKSGGVTQNGEIFDIDNRGAGGIEVYKKYGIEKKLASLLAKNVDFKSDNEKLIHAIDFIVKENFFNPNNSFSERKLKERPFSMTFFELVLIENQIYFYVFKNIENVTS